MSGRGSPLSVVGVYAMFDDLPDIDVPEWTSMDDSIPFDGKATPVTPPATTPVTPPATPPSPAIPESPHVMSRKERMQAHREAKAVSDNAFRAACEITSPPTTFSGCLDLFDDMGFFVNATQFDVSLCIGKICFIYVSIPSPWVTDAEVVVSEMLSSMKIGRMLHCERTDYFQSPFWYENNGYGLQSATNIMHIASMYNQGRNDANVHLKLMEGSAFVYNGDIVFRDGGHRFTLMLMTWLTEMKPRTPDDLYRVMRFFPFIKTLSKDIRDAHQKITQMGDCVEFIFPESWVAYFNRSMSIHVTFVSSTKAVFKIRESTASV